MVDWNEVHMIDGWTVSKTSSGTELTCQLWATTREVFPTRGTPLPATGSCMPPITYISYRIKDISTVKLSGAGPYLAQVTATGRWGADNKDDGEGVLLAQKNRRMAYTDFHILPEWCGLRPGPATTKPTKIDLWSTGKWASAIEGEETGKWVKWEAGYKGHDGIYGSPFRRMLNPTLADTTQRFLTVICSFYIKETTSGLENWAAFGGIVPINSMPKWIQIPGGDNRWRVYDEELEDAVEEDGRTKLFKVTRTLLGVPNIVKDSTDSRAEWEQAVIGQKDWADI